MVFDAHGKPLPSLAVAGEPSCLAVGGAGAQVPGAVLRRPDGTDRAVWTTRATWRPSGPRGWTRKSVLTSLAVAEEDLFVADAGSVWCCDYDSRAGNWSAGSASVTDRGDPRLHDPQPVLRRGGHRGRLLRVANPARGGSRRTRFDGDLLGHWGKASSAIDGFFGCCNPANFAVLPDGRFVTVEKGMPRVKVYSKQGEFECVVATPQDSGPRHDRSARTIREDHATEAVRRGGRQPQAACCCWTPTPARCGFLRRKDVRP